MSKIKDRSADMSVTKIVDNSIDIGLDQASDESLVKCRYEAKAGKKRYYKKGAISWCFEDCGILLRRYQSRQANCDIVTQVIVPRSHRANILRSVHESNLAGHSRVKHAKQQIMCNYWWPGIEKDIRIYCRSIKRRHKPMTETNINKGTLISDCKVRIGQNGKTEGLITMGGSKYETMYAEWCDSEATAKIKMYNHF